MLVIIYGISGSGKTYLGKLLKRNFDFFFWDGDNALTERMITSIKNKIPFTQDVRDEFINALSKNIKFLKKIVGNKNLVISQALYKSVNRKSLMKEFPDAIFIHTDSTDETILQRLKNRNNNLDPNYLMSKIRPHFECPDEEELSRTFIINNNEDNENKTLSSLAETLNIVQNTINCEKFSGKLVDIDIIFESTVNNDNQNIFQLGCELIFEPGLRKINFNSLNNLENNQALNNFRIQVNQDNSLVVENDTIELYQEWLSQKIIQQAFDLSILLGKSNALLYSLDNKFTIFSENDKKSLINNIINYLNKHIRKIELKNPKVIQFRRAIPSLNAYYEKFFNLSNRLYKNSIPQSLHLIKTFNHNRNFLQRNTFIPAKFYRNTNQTNPPTIIYFPGSAYTRMMEGTIDKVSLKLVLHTGCNVFTVHYRLAPENLFPSALFDGLNAYLYILKNSSNLRIDKDKILLSGYSSGATLALQLCHLIATDNTLTHPTAIALISPIVDFSYLNNEKSQLNSNDRLIKVEFVRNLHSIYFSKFTDLANPYISTLFAADQSIQCFPRIFIFKLGNDIYSPQNQIFVDKFRSRNATVDFTQIPYLDHCSWWDNQILWEMFSKWIRPNYSISDEVEFDIHSIVRNTLPTLGLPDSIPLSTDNTATKETINEVYNHLLQERGDPQSPLKTADKYPECKLLQIYAVLWCFLANSDDFKKYYERIYQLNNNISDYELSIIQAITFLREKKIREAIEKFSEIVTKWPEDLLSIILFDFLCQTIGLYEYELNIFNLIKARYINNHRLISSSATTYFLSRYGNILAISGNLNQALHYIGHSLAINPINIHARKTLSHICLRLENPDMAISLLKNYKDSWLFFCNHISFDCYLTLSILSLSTNDVDSAFFFYNETAKSCNTFYDRTQLVFLLWQLDLNENLTPTNKIQIENKWHELTTETNNKDIEQYLVDNNNINYFFVIAYLYLFIRTNNHRKQFELLNFLTDNKHKKYFDLTSKLISVIIDFINQDYFNSYSKIKGLAKDISHNANINQIALLKTISNISANELSDTNDNSKNIAPLNWATFFVSSDNSNEDNRIIESHHSMRL